MPGTQGGRRGDCDSAVGQGALYSQGLSTPNSGPLVEVPIGETALGRVWEGARPWCQTTAGNASITNEFRVSLGKEEFPANRGNCGKLLGPPASERPPGMLLLYHFPLGPVIPKISDVSLDPGCPPRMLTGVLKGWAPRPAPIMPSLLSFPR